MLKRNVFSSYLHCVFNEKSRGEAVRQKGSEVPMSRYVDSVIH